MEQKFVVLFVEGQTEKEFFEALIRFYRKASSTQISHSKIFNLKGITLFEKKVPTTLKYEIIPDLGDVALSIVCCHDTDVFELARNPPVNWQALKKKLKELGITDFIQIKAERMIEDWFLLDLDGLCKFLKADRPKNLSGKDGLAKIKTLFKKNGKIYAKGQDTGKFIAFLDIALIRRKIKGQLLPLEKALGVQLKRVTLIDTLLYPTLGISDFF